MGSKMKTAERIENGLKRILELLTLITEWTKGKTEKDLLTKEFNNRKKELIKELYQKLAKLNDTYLFTGQSEFRTKQYIIRYEEIKSQIRELEK